MSIAPQPAHTWPPQPIGPPRRPRRRWPAIAAAAAGGALAGGVITTLVTFAATPSTPSAAPPETVTVTAAPPAPPTPLPVAEADAQTCHAWGTADRLVTAAASAMSVIPDGVQFTDPAMDARPGWKAAVVRASTFFDQAASTFEVQIAPGTSPTLRQISDTTVSALRTLSEAYSAFDPASGHSVAVFQASQQAMDWLCR